MPLFAPRVQETSTTTGTADFALAGAPAGYDTFAGSAALGNGAVAGYFAFMGTDWEEGYGVVTAGAPDTLARNAVRSTNGGAKVNWGAGTKVIICVPLSFVLAGLAASSKGAARPGWLPAGGIWLKDTATPWELYQYDGADDILVAFINATTNEALPAVRSADGGAAEGPVLAIERLSPSPAANDVLGAIAFKAKDSGGATVTVAKLKAQYVDPAAGTATALLVMEALALALADKELREAKIRDYSVKHTALTITAGAITIDLSLGNSFYLQLTANVTSISIVNWPAADYAEFALEVEQDATGGRTMSGWPAAVKWVGGIAYAPSAAANAIDRVFGSSRNAGARILAEHAKGYA